MSGGGVGNGVSYWANIQVSGNLDKDDMKKLKEELDKLLTGKINGKNVNGKVASEARASDNNATVTLNVTY
jgi:hypothetical protein